VGEYLYLVKDDDNFENYDDSNISIIASYWRTLSNYSLNNIADTGETSRTSINNLKSITVPSIMKDSSM